MALHDGTWTMLFTDIVGSTEQRTRLGDDVGDALRREHDAILDAAVADRGGEVVKGTGDGALVAFGGAAEALGCAVAVHQGIDRRNRRAEEPLSVRIGLSLGDARYEANDLHGTAVVEAARLCALADGGEILCSDVVRAVAGSRATQDFESVGPVELRGLPDPVLTWRVLWEPAADAERGGRPPMPSGLEPGTRFEFVGRDEELDELHTLWKQVAEGDRALALIAGEPGIGKTRLAIELARRAYEQDATVLYGRCDDELGVPYQPFVEALAFDVEHADALTLEERLGRDGGELARLVPDLAARVPGLPPPLRSDPETEQYRLFQAVAGWLAAASRTTPVLLVLDDLHWAAKPTLLLLRHVAAASEPGRVLIVGTYRDTDLDRSHPLSELLADFRRLPNVARASLTGLDQAGVVEFLERTAGHDLDAAGLTLAHAIHGETEGNPFFVGEVLRHLVETGRIYERDGRWTTDDPSSVGIPEGVREVIGRRLNRLSEQANHALSVASVSGRDFELAVVGAVSHLDEDVLLGALDEALEARLLREVGVGRYQFAHALVRSALYDEIRPTHRARLHQQIGTALEAAHADAIDRHLGELAHHFAHAGPGDPGKALEYCRRAAARALDQRAPDEAVTYYEQALELLEDFEGGDDGARGHLLLGLGIAQRRAGIAGYREVLLDAARVAEQHGDTELLVEAALANNRGFFSAVGAVDEERIAVVRQALDALAETEDPRRARLLANLAGELVFGAPLDERRAITDTAAAIARRLDDPPTLVHVLISRALSLTHPSTLDERLGLTEEMIECARGLHDPYLEFFATWYRLLACVEASLGEEIDALLTDLARFAGECGQATPEWMELFTRAGLRLRTGEHATVEELAVLQLEAGQRAGQPDAAFYFGVLYFALRRQEGRLDEIAELVGNATREAAGLVGVSIMEGIALAELGQLDDACAVLDEVAAKNFDDILFNQIWSSVMWGSALVAAKVGDRERSERLIQLLAPHEDCLVYNGLVCFGSIAAILGRLATAVERFDDADAWFRRGAELEERIGAPALVAQTRCWWATALRARGEDTDAARVVELAEQARATATELGLGGVTRQLDALG